MIEGVGSDISIWTNAAWQTGGGQNIEFVIQFKSVGLQRVPRA